MRRSSPFLAAATALLIHALAGTAAADGVAAGARLPEIGLKTADGKQITSKGLAGKVVIVDFWATWCAPCKEELPVLQRLYKKYASKGLVVVGVSVDRDGDAARKFAKKLKLTFPILHDGKHEVSGRFEPGTMPTSYVVDRKGVVRHVHAGYRAGDDKKIESEIRALLGL